MRISWCMPANRSALGVVSRSLLVAMMVTLSGGLGSSVLALESDGEKDYSQLPGYVDIQGLGIFTEEDATVEVYLHDALLAMVAEMARHAEPELSEVLAGLQLVRVQRYRMDDDQLDKVNEKTRAMAKELEKADWTRVVRIREQDEIVYVYFKLGETMVHGVTVMVIEEYEGFATFVNIVGDIDPAQVGKLGRKFNIDALDMDWDDFQDLENLNDRDRDRQRDKDKDKTGNERDRH